MCDYIDTGIKPEFYESYIKRTFGFKSIYDDKTHELIAVPAKNNTTGEVGMFYLKEQKFLNEKEFLELLATGKLVPQNE